MILFPNGQELTTLNTKVPFKNDKGEVIGLIGIGRDITERKRMEAELDYERGLLRMMLDNSPDHIYFKDTRSRFMKVSNALAIQFGMKSPEELLGKTDFDFFDEAHARQAFEDEQEILRTGRPVIAKEEREVWKDGHVTWASSTKMPMRDATGKIIGIMGITRDITERKRLEEHLIQSQKMETVGKLAGGIAHEFNSILTAIIGQSELLIQDLPAGSPLARNATEISQAADRAAGLTRQLLAYGRKQFLRPEALNLNQILAGMSGVLKHLVGGETVDVNLVPGAGIKAVKADAGQIEQVIINLAMNARDAMPGGGKFTLETGNVTLSPEYVGRYADLKAGEYVMLAVTDTGRGMSEAVKARVFEPFFTTKDIGQGTGLGLSTCYGIIKQSGGHINVYSEAGRGTTFKIYLPAVEAGAGIARAGGGGGNGARDGDDLAGGGRSGVAGAGGDAVAAAGLHGVGGGQRDRGVELETAAGSGARGPAVHGRGDAAHEREGIVGAGAGAVSAHADPVHVGLHGECDRASGGAGQGRGAAAKTLHPLRPGPQSPRRAGSAGRFATGLPAGNIQ